MGGKWFPGQPTDPGRAVPVKWILPGKGRDVTLIDRWEPGHVRASPSDTTRILRMIHGRDKLQTEWVRQSRLRRLELQEEMKTIFVP